jgi:S1-C subfamily serine protease
MFNLKLRQCRPLLLSAVIGLSLAHTAMARRAIPDDNLGYPVLISLKAGGSGSGFYLNNGSTVYLVTARHVLFDPTGHKLNSSEAELLSYSKDPADLDPNVLSVQLTALEQSGDLKAHRSEDVAVIKIGTFLAKVEPNSATASPLSLSPGVTLQTSNENGLVTVSPDIVKTFNQVLTGNEVIEYGYPTSLGLQELPQLDLRRPLLRKGIVAGLNPQKRSIILDCPAYPGNSGGPVLQIENEVFQIHFEVIGVVREYVPFADVSRHSTFAIFNNSGYSIATPMDYVWELINNQS